MVSRNKKYNTIHTKIIIIDTVINNSSNIQSFPYKKKDYTR